MNTDPTREEMLAHLASLPFAREFEEFDREEALYWFASDWHGGQWSNLYAALCASPFHPSPLARGPEEPARMLVDELQAQFAECEPVDESGPCGEGEREERANDAWATRMGYDQ